MTAVICNEFVGSQLHSFLLTMIEVIVTKLIIVTKFTKFVIVTKCVIVTKFVRCRPRSSLLTMTAVIVTKFVRSRLRSPFLMMTAVAAVSSIRFS